MFISHRTLQCKFISKASNEPWNPSEHHRPHQICGVNSTAQWGAPDPQSAASHCYVTLGSAGASPQAPGSATVAPADPIQTVKRVWKSLFQISGPSAFAFSEGDLFLTATSWNWFRRRLGNSAVYLMVTFMWWSVKKKKKKSRNFESINKYWLDPFYIDKIKIKINAESFSSFLNMI